MTIQDFLVTFFCVVTVHDQANRNRVVKTEVIRRDDKKVVDRVVTTYDILDISEKIADSQTRSSLMPFDWEKVLEHTKRAQLDYVVQRAPIENYYPMNSDTDISVLYI